MQRYLSSEREVMSDAEIAKVHEIAEELRERLVDISWFMRCLNEFIARMANKEDGCKGRFWEGRFKSQALLDEVAVLACMAYVDLNPIRAGIAETPKQSDFTSIQERIKSYQAESVEITPADNLQQDYSRTAENATYTSNMSPLLLDFIGNERHDQPKGITYSIEDYLQLVDWTGRAIADGKRGAIPSELPPIFNRLKVDPEQWVSTVQQFQRRYPRMAGSMAQLKTMCEQLGLRWMHGVGVSRLLYQ